MIDFFMFVVKNLYMRRCQKIFMKLELQKNNNQELNQFMRWIVDNWKWLEYTFAHPFILCVFWIRTVYMKMCVCMWHRNRDKVPLYLHLLYLNKHIWMMWMNMLQFPSSLTPLFLCQKHLTHELRWAYGTRKSVHIR